MFASGSSCPCGVCAAVLSLVWTRLAGEVWVLSAVEHLFAPPTVLAIIDSAGEAVWFTQHAAEAA